MKTPVSRRLQTIAQFVPMSSRVADIGSDHAYLPIYLVQSGKVSFAIAGEVNEGPWKAAQSQVHSYGLSKQIDVRKGDGLSVIKPGEVDVICIAGMGGALIVKILQEGLPLLQQGHIKRIILQPNVGERLVREWMLEHNWQLTDERILEEDNKIYEVLVAEPGDGKQPYLQGGEYSIGLLLEIGPHLWQGKSPILAKKWRAELQKWQKILDNISHSSSPEAYIKQENIKQKINMLKEVVQCLPKVKP